jgi:hypothetical protein
MSTATKATHAGWWRRGRRDRWRRVVEGDSFDRCWHNLLVAADDLPPGGELLVVAVNADPNTSATGPRRPAGERGACGEGVSS